jgi:hypothetical protein
LKRLTFILVLVIAYAAYQQFLVPRVPTSNTSPAVVQPAPRAEQWRPGQQVQGSGRVIRILSDDNDGSRHQRFILELSSGQTLLIAHNIDLAPRVSSLKTGDTVDFYGEYEPNSQGGVIHWTHHDPQGRHVAGWLEHNGRRYQ